MPLPDADARPAHESLRRHSATSLSLALLLAAMGFGCQGQAGPVDTTPAETAAAADSTAETASGADDAADAPQSNAAESNTAEANAAEPEVVDDCAEGVVLDDGSVETGYGFVPSSSWGVFVQAFESSAFSSREIGKVCVCWLRTRPIDEVDYEVVFYEDMGGAPAAEPYAAVQGKATEVPNGVAEAGRFYSVDIDGVTIPEGRSYIGVRFDPSVARFFFVCTNKSEESPIIDGFQKDDRSKRWSHVLYTSDPSFTGHRSVLIRATPKPIGDG